MRWNEIVNQTLLEYKGQFFDLDYRHNIKVTDALKLAKKICKIKRIKVNDVISMQGTLPGHSDEPDMSPEFLERVSGLDLEAYDKNKYPPILIIRDKGSYSIADGRHRVVNYIQLLKDAGRNVNPATIQAYVLDLDNPKIMAYLKKQATYHPRWNK
jgi:hypothetical protein